MEIKKPHSCSIVLLTQCFFKCKMCEMWKAQEAPGTVSIEEWKSFISSLEGILDNQKELVFSGGEPLLHKDIFELIEYGTKRGFKTLMPSNGFLIDENVAKRLAHAGLKEIFISLDSTNPKTHDFLRGVEGAHAKVMRAFDNLAKFCPDLRIGIICVVSGVNHHEIVDLIKWVKEAKFLSGVYFQAIAKPFFVPLDDTWHAQGPFAFLWPKQTGDIHATVEQMLQLKKENYPIHNFPLQLEIFKTYFTDPTKRARKAACYLGDYVVNVNPQGDISLCCFMPPIGNIKKDDITTLWYSELAKQKRVQMHCCDVNCNNMVNCFFKEDEER
jgi:MoaA/NifB/PqqE/SkfB family radical SAM enzyme